jgi:UPF0755 protein
MFKKLVTGLLVIVIIAAGFIGWRFFTSNTAFDDKSKFLYIRTGEATYDALLQTIRDSNYVHNPGSFAWLGQRMNLDKSVKPGRYEITKGMSLVNMVRMLRNGRQAPVNLVITKFRTKESLAGAFGRKLECDSLAVIQYLNNNDSLKAYGLDSHTVMAMIHPDTYTTYWNTTPGAVFKKFYAQHKAVWTDERKQLAKQQGLTPITATTLASIVDEESNDAADKANIASVYLNRYRKGMRLQADPTIKFAMKNFGLKRIYIKYLGVESPYNTYKYAGLPPGPICTPSPQTLDIVLRAPATTYLYFAAKSDFSGTHVFSSTYEEHLKNAKALHQALDAEEKIREAARDNIDSPK